MKLGHAVSCGDVIEAVSAARSLILSSPGVVNVVDSADFLENVSFVLLPPVGVMG